MHVILGPAVILKWNIIYIAAAHKHKILQRKKVLKKKEKTHTLF